MIVFRLHRHSAQAAVILLTPLLFLLTALPAHAALEGRGTEEEPYLVRTVEDLITMGFTQTIGIEKKHYRLDNDIDASGEELPYLFGYYYPFMGVLDGAGHKITYRCTKNELMHGGHTTWKEKGALFCENHGTIKNLIVEGSVDFAFDRDPEGLHSNFGAGGIVYKNSGLIENCISRVDISAKIQPNWTPWGLGIQFTDMPGIGGIAAINVGGRIVNCAYTGTISVDNSAVMLCEDLGCDGLYGKVRLKAGDYVNGMVGGIVGVTGNMLVYDGYGNWLKTIDGINESCVFAGHIVLSDRIRDAANGTGVGPIWGYNDGASGAGARVWDTARITAGDREYKPSDVEFPGRGDLDNCAFVNTRLLSILLNSALMGDVRVSADVSYFTSEEGREPGGTQWHIRMEEGASPGFNIYPSPGYTVKYAALDGTNLGAVDSYRFAPLTEDGHTLSVYFSPKGGAGFTPLPVVSPIKLDASSEALKVSMLPAIEFAKIPSEVQGFAEKDASGTAVTDPLAARLTLAPTEESVDLESLILTMPITLCGSDKGVTALTAYQCSLSGYAGEKMSDLKIFAMLSPENSAELTRVRTPRAIRDGEFAITDAEGEVLSPDALIQEDEIYFVNVAFKDGGIYDLDPEEGKLLFAAFAVKGREKEYPDTPGSEGESSASKSSSGCNAGPASFALLALPVLPAAAATGRKKRRRGGSS